MFYILFCSVVIIPGTGAIELFFIADANFLV